METVAQDTADLRDAIGARQLGMTRTSCDHRRQGGPSSDPARIIEINWQTEALQMAPTGTTRGVCLCSALLPSQYFITSPRYFPDRSTFRSSTPRCPVTHHGHASSVSSRCRYKAIRTAFL